MSKRPTDAPRAATTAARGRPGPAPTHCCAADRCYVRVAAHHLMCPDDWRALPRDIKSAVLRHYRRGQTAHTATPAYLDAMAAAVEALRSPR